MRSFVFIVVNAEAQADHDADRSGDVPSVSREARAVADIPLGRYSSDSQERLREALVHWSREPPGAGSAPLRTYYVEVSPQAPDPEPELQGLGRLPTALSLPPSDVRRLVDAGRRIFHRSPELARLLEDLRLVK